MNHVADNIIHEDGIKTKQEYYVKELTNRLRLIWDFTKNNIQNSRNVMKKQYDKKVAVRHFRLGDIVLSKQDKIPAQAFRKLYRNFSEKQYYITKVLPNCTFILGDLETNKEIKAPVNINRLKASLRFEISWELKAFYMKENMFLLTKQYESSPLIARFDLILKKTFQF